MRVREREGKHARTARVREGRESNSARFPLSLSLSGLFIAAPPPPPPRYAELVTTTDASLPHSTTARDNGDLTVTLLVTVR